MTTEPRGERLQIMLTKEELTAVDHWRFDRHMPSRAAAVRELLRRGLSAEGFAVADGDIKSGDDEWPDKSWKDATGQGKPGMTASSTKADAPARSLV